MWLMHDLLLTPWLRGLLVTSDGPRRDGSCLFPGLPALAGLWGGWAVAEEGSGQGYTALPSPSQLRPQLETTVS